MGRLFQTLLLVTTLAASGCGTLMWAITPRPEVTYTEIPHTTTVTVRSSIPGATILVDGAEAGATPRGITVAHRELRRQRRQSLLLPIIGTAVDVLLFTIATAAIGDSAHDAGPVLLSAGVGIGVATLDLWLITGKSVVNEGVESLPSATEIGVHMQGYADVARKIRVPDITQLDFHLQPLPAPEPHVVDNPPR